jgi:hypothetical protein
MAARSWTLLDVEKNEYLDSRDGRVTLATDRGACHVHKSTLRGGLSDGVDVLEVVNGDFRFRVVPTRGMGLWDATLAGERFGWKSPVRGPVHPSFVDLGEPSGLGWLDGFNELMARCGLESNGAPDFGDDGQLTYPLHGRIANKPAHRVLVTIDDDHATIVGETEETRFHFLKLRMVTTITTRRGMAGLEIRDEIHNLSESPAKIQMLYHVNFGLPLLDAGARFVAPLKTVVPRNQRAADGIDAWDNYQAEQAGFEEQVYFMKLLADANGASRAMLKNAHGHRGASLTFNIRQLPCFTVWKNTTAAADGYVTGIEPGTNFPNPRSYETEQRRVVELSPSGSFAFDLGLQFHASADSVDEAEAKVAALQGNVEPEIMDQPQPGWCAS